MQVIRFASEAGRGPRLELTIDPIDDHTGVADNQRAELATILKAFKVPHAGNTLMLCTDGLSSMYRMDIRIRCLSLHVEYKYDDLLAL